MRPHDVRGRLVRRAAKNNVFIGDPLADRLTAYYELLVRWNRKINLTSLENLDEAIDRLLLEPLVASRYFCRLPTGSWMWAPVAVRRRFRSSWRFRGSNSPWSRPRRGSPPSFERPSGTSLEDVQVETARYEELLARPELHEAHDVVSLRAVRTEARVLTTLQAFLAPGGVLMLFRGPSGPQVPATLVPPLEWTATHPLIESLQSRLTILTKRRIR